MGNTNLPQAGAAHTKNSRDTLSGGNQLTDQEKSQKNEQEDVGVGPAPSRPKNAPARIPGQLRDPENEDNVDGTDSEQRDRNESVEQPVQSDDPRTPETPIGAGKPPPLGGHGNTGHSQSKAT